MRRKRRPRQYLDQATISANASRFGVQLPSELSPTERFLSPNEIGKILGLTGEAVKQWIYARRLPAVKLSNGYWRVKVSDFEDFLKHRVDLGKIVMMISSSPLKDYENVRIISPANDVDAILKLNEYQPAVVVVDTSCNGWEFVKKVRNHVISKRVPIIVISPDGSKVDSQHAIEFEVQSFMINPSNEMIISEIKKVSERRFG
jgi:CheY-like chemotaxis protein